MANDLGMNARAIRKSLPRAMTPTIQVDNPKITRKLSTAWFATRVDAGYGLHAAVIGRSLQRRAKANPAPFVVQQLERAVVRRVEPHVAAQGRVLEQAIPFLRGARSKRSHASVHSAKREI